MGFLTPWFLGGLLALGVPVFVHLLRRHITVPRPVGSLMFFERGKQSSTRHRRLQHLLLFALRCALLLLLVLAFANPFVRRRANDPSGRLLLIVLDNSFSMRAGSRFADARREALALLAAKPAAQKAQIIALGGRVEVLTEAVSDSVRLNNALESIQPGDGHASLGELGRTMRALAEGRHGMAELHLFSDMQKSAMPANFADMVLPPATTVVVHAVAAQTVPNWTVASVDAPTELSDIRDPQRSRVTAVVEGLNTPATARNVSLVIDGRVVATKRVDVPANGRANVVFAPLEAGFGFNRCEVRIDDADAFPLDDVARFAVRRADPQRVLFVHAEGDARSELYFGSALRAAAQSSFTLQAVSPPQAADLDPARFAFVVIADAVTLPPIFERNLQSFVAKGGNVLVALGTGAGHHATVPLWGSAVKEVHEYGRGGAAAGIGQVDFTYPSFEDAQGGRDNGGWAGAKVMYAAAIDASGSRVAAKLNDGTPLLLEKTVGEGHVLVLTSGLDNLTNDFPLHPIFVAFVDRTARYLSGTERLSGSRRVGSYVQLRTSTAVQNASAASAEIVAPDGSRPLSLEQARVAQTFRLQRAGFYTVRFANGRDAVIGVNPDRLESDLQPMPAELVSLWSGSGSTAAGQDATTANAVPASAEYARVSLWWWVMLLALLVALAETALASRYMGTPREDA